MPALIVIFSILALIFFILFLNVSLVIEHKEKTVTHWKVLFFKKKAFYEKPRKLKRSMSKKEAEKIKAQLEKEKKDKQKKDREKREKRGEDGAKQPSEIITAIKSAAVIIKQLLSSFSKYLKIKLAKIDVTVGTPDAADTAVAYGAITGSINVLLPLLEETKNFSTSKHCKINVAADFTAEECKMELKIVLSLRVWQLIKIALATLIKLAKHSINSMN